MNQYLRKAAKAWAGATLNVKRFADAYAEACENLGKDGADMFAEAYPMFGAREWSRLEKIASGELLPQFFLKSDFFVNKLLRMKSSARVQKALVGASSDGRIRVDRGNGPEKVRLSDLTRGEEKALALLLSEESEKLPGSTRIAKYRDLIMKVNKSNTRHRPAWEIRTVNGRTVAHFNRACNMDRGDLEEALDAVKKGTGKSGSPLFELMSKIVEEVRKLESLRDDEWDFLDRHGHDGTGWSHSEAEEHHGILNDIQAARTAVRRLFIEATGDDEIDV